MVARPGQAAEIGQPRQRHVHPERARATAPVGHPLARGRRYLVAIKQVFVEQFRIEVGDHRTRGDALALQGFHAHRAAALDQHPAHAGLGADPGTGGDRRTRHRLGDRAHATDRMAPGPLDPVALAKRMVQQHIGRARGIRTGVVAHHPVEAEQGLDRLALEPAVQVLGRRDREQVQQLLAQRRRQCVQAPAELPCPPQLRQHLQPVPVGDVGRRLQGNRAQHVGEHLQALLIPRQLLRVARREALQLGLGQRAAGQQVLAARQGQEVVDPARHHDQPVRGQVELGDHLGLQQRDGIGGH
ncbi:hypothetical protein D3C71_1221670 [compost metagenome]